MRFSIVGYVWIGVLFLTLSNSSIGQVRPDSVIVRFSKWVDYEIGIENNGLYQGPIYLMISPSRYTHQFFNSKIWQNGNICIRDQWYFDVPMVFDVEKEILVIRHPDISRRDGIAMDMRTVSFFEFANHSFRKLDATNSRGFYDILYDGEKIGLVCKRKKTTVAKDGGILYKVRDSYFLRFQGRLIALTNRKSLLEIDTRSKNISREISKTHNVKLKLSKEGEMVEFISYYDKRLANL